MSVRDVIQAAAGASTTASKTYIEDVFSTYLYTGTGVSQSIQNGIQLGPTGGTGGSSVYFDAASAASLTVAANTAFNFGTGAFTIEYWMRPSTSDSDISFGYGNYGSGNGEVGFYVQMGGGTVSCQRTRAAATATDQVGECAIIPGEWTHIAIVRTGTTTTFYVNGNNCGQLTDSTSYSTAFGLRIGSGDNYTSNSWSPFYNFTGNISNFRIVKGTAVYTANFTPPSTDLTAISGTSLLTCQGASPLVDNSSNAFTITNVNAVAKTDMGPFNQTAGKGGMVWIKGRSGATDHALYDTARGATYDLGSNLTTAQTTQSTGLTSFNTNGFSIGALAKLNTNASTYASWTFRKAPKFFDVVTYTGNGSTNRQISHSLGQAPGMIMVKRTDTSGGWTVYHRSLGATYYLALNSTQAAFTYTGNWNDTAPTSSNFTVGDYADVNASGGTYVAYLFAHDTTTDGLIQCGSFTTDISGDATISLGWEPQYFLIKCTSSADGWKVVDNMRGFVSNGRAYDDAVLSPNSSAAESSGARLGNPLADGVFVYEQLSNATYIYMAIRRGPMRTPTDGTKVFNASTYTGSVTSTIPNDRMLSATDFWINIGRAGSGHYVLDRLRGWNYLDTANTNAENTGYLWSQTNQTTLKPDSGWWTGTPSQIDYYFKRAPGFFDAVCYTGTGTYADRPHNLSVPPELIISKVRSTTDDWYVLYSVSGTQYLGKLNLSDSVSFAGGYSTTVSVFSPVAGDVSGRTYVNYLFASCPGVSKVGSYTGNGSSQTINCGFSAGARFVLIKRTDSTGDWYVWDTARGIVAANDPHMSLNTASAEVTTDDTVDPASSGFIVNQVTATNVNVNTATYIFLAVA